ncbi:hypothetical protein NDU88_000324 [Pleurodeles waltl]|uniref:Uncharacterized protein n=1 Tax=Pleurodeles waltl TaxID=8319 RepID=A0AAV7WHV7_PLEWA|nr:hypothetical protein NDU88_000324 [Pleurodeles waltl]
MPGLAELAQSGASAAKLSMTWWEKAARVCHVLPAALTCPGPRAPCIGGRDVPQAAAERFFMQRLRLQGALGAELVLFSSHSTVVQHTCTVFVGAWEADPCRGGQRPDCVLAREAEARRRSGLALARSVAAVRRDGDGLQIDDRGGGTPESMAEATLGIGWAMDCSQLLEAAYEGTHTEHTDTGRLQGPRPAALCPALGF